MIITLVSLDGDQVVDLERLAWQYHSVEGPASCCGGGEDIAVRCQTRTLNELDGLARAMTPPVSPFSSSCQSCH